MICARSATIESAEDMIGYEEMERDEQEKLDALVEAINKIRGDPSLKREYKKSVEDLKKSIAPKKTKKKVQSPAKAGKKRSLEIVIQETFTGSGKNAMDLLLDACRKTDVKIPQDDPAARSRLGGYLMTASPKGRSSGIWQVKDAYNAAKKELGGGLAEGGGKKSKSSNSGPPDATVEKNQKLVDAFYELYEGHIESNTFKGITCRKVANTLAELEFEVTSGAAISKGKGKVPGIGKSTGAKIDEILETGTCGDLEELRSG